MSSRCTVSYIRNYKCTSTVHMMECKLKGNRTSVYVVCMSTAALHYTCVHTKHDMFATLLQCNEIFVCLSACLRELNPTLLCEQARYKLHEQRSINWYSRRSKNMHALQYALLFCLICAQHALSAGACVIDSAWVQIQINGFWYPQKGRPLPSLIFIKSGPHRWCPSPSR